MPKVGSLVRMSVQGKKKFVLILKEIPSRRGKMQHKVRILNSKDELVVGEDALDLPDSEHPSASEIRDTVSDVSMEEVMDVMSEDDMRRL